MGFASGEFLMLLPAMLRPGKGHEVLLAALASIGSRREAPVLIAGAGEREEELRALARPHGDAVVSSARAGYPGVASVMRHGRTALASRSAANGAYGSGRGRAADRGDTVGGTPELIEDNRTGLLVAPDDPDQLASAVLDLWSHREKARTAGQECAHRGAPAFDLETQTERTLSLWAEVAALVRR